jgi:hypothetical protein
VYLDVGSSKVVGRPVGWEEFGWSADYSRTLDDTPADLVE